LKGSVSDFEQRKLQDIVPSLANTPEGIAKLAEIAQRIAVRKEQIADLAEESGRLSQTGFYKKQREFLKTPILSRAEWDEIEAFAKKTGPTANPAARQPSQAAPPMPTIKVVPDGNGGWKQVQ